ncbi:endonuclease/exonuclease/phosphatase family protein [Kamptonema cortianum]|nr:endonuclease/exonuclease/phosphatase family protein [Geitlerinema splendidum]MDK3158358.1 endonuclease/exonuclease/phosphatase family protein [Kamptonema cortianum]
MRIQAFLATLLAAGIGLTLQQSSVPLKQPDYTRAMTYNIQWFHDGDDPTRLKNLKEVLDDIKPDIVGVQEVEGKAALQQIFDNEWALGIMDIPAEYQEIGIAVRKPYRLLSYELIFTGEELNYAFPGDRDVMRAVIETPNKKTLVVYVNHFKSRSGGRMQTDAQRQMACGMLAAYIANKGDENVIVMGDFNDAPNDASTNILESGNVLAKGGPKGEYTLLANATEALAEQDYVTIGLHDLYSGGAPVRARVVGAKAENDRLRGRDYRFPADVRITQSFFDQILVSPNLFARGANARVYDGVAAYRGLPGRVQVTNIPETGGRSVVYTEKGTLASDHLPVYVDVQVR